MQNRDNYEKNATTLKWIVNFFGIVIVVFWLATIILICNHGWLAFIGDILRTPYTWLEEKGYLRHDAILGVASTIGISSALIGWTYGSLSNKSLGVKCGELLHHFCWWFHFSVISHAVAVFLSIWFTSAESFAAVSVPHYVLGLLGVIVSSLILHAIVLVCFVLGPTTRHELTIKYWLDQFKQSNNEEILVKLELVERHVCVDESNVCLKICQLRNANLRKYYMQTTNYSHAGDVSSALVRMSYSWENLLDNKTVSQQSSLIGSCFDLAIRQANLDQPGLRNGFYFAYCTSYAIYYARKVMTLNRGMNKQVALEEVHAELSRLSGDLCACVSEMSIFRQYLQLLKNLNGWRSFFCYNLHFTRDLLADWAPVCSSYQSLRDLGLAYLSVTQMPVEYQYLDISDAHSTAWSLSCDHT